MADWKAAQTEKYETAGVAFNVNAGWNVDGYVLQGVAEIKYLGDPTEANATREKPYFGLCI